MAVTVVNGALVFRDADGNVGYLRPPSAADMNKIAQGVRIYSTTRAYDAGYVVRSGADLYQALTAVAAGTPLTDTTAWRKVVSVADLPGDATTEQAGLTELATAAEVAAGTAGKIPDAAQVKAVADALGDTIDDLITVQDTAPVLENAQGVITPAENILDPATDEIVPRTGLAYAIAATPNWFRRRTLPTPNKTTVTVPAGLQVNINDTGYILTTARTLALDDAAAAATRAGKDMFIYACVPESGTEPDLVLSLNSTAPAGYDADTSRKIGGFHCLCVSVGTIAGHTLSGYAAGDILPASVWDLLHRAESDNAGMVYDPRGFWVDIYLPSWDGSRLVSAYGGTIVDRTSAKPMHGELFAEYFPKVGKRLITREEFVSFAEGSNQGTHIKGDADPGTTGGHYDTANRRMVSNLGCEDCCGALWQWTGDTYESWTAKINGTATSIDWQYNTAGRENYLHGYSWQDDRVVYNDAIDPEKRGSAYALLRRSMVGGCWGDASPRPGSRCVACHAFGVRVDAGCSARGVARARVVNM